MHPLPFSDDVTSPLSTLGGSSLETFAANQNLGMCVSIDPRRGYRWNTRRCTGPDRARFICQLPGKCKAELGLHPHNMEHDFGLRVKASAGGSCFSTEAVKQISLH